MDNTNLEEVKRALTDPTTTPFTTMDLEELESKSLIKTPVDTPLFNMLRSGAVPADSRYFEWIETALNATLTGGKYDGYTVPSDQQSTLTRTGNYIMAYGQVAKVSNLTKSFKSVDGNALIHETRTKYLNLLRGIEYYLWNGDNSGGDETDGVIEMLTNTLANGGGALAEAKFQQALVNAYDSGIVPKVAYCTPNVAYRIANFAEDRISNMTPMNAANGIGISAFTYHSPFGYNIQIQPVRSTFISTGSVYLIDTDLMTLRYTGDSLLQAMKLPIAYDGEAILLKSYFGLELKEPEKHVVITGVADILS